MQVQQLINQQGPLPLQSVFTAASGKPALLVVTGALWSESANYLLQMNVTLDGTQIGTAKTWSNGSNTVRVLPTLFIGLPALGSGQHTLVLTPQVVEDWSDVGFFSASLIF
jgi:hypothetical protein